MTNARAGIRLRLPLLCLLAAGLAVLSGCAPAAAPSPSASAAPEPSAYITMDTQYYDTAGNIVEIPVLAGDDSADAQSINRELLALRDSFSESWEAPYEGVYDQLMAYPTDTGRYLNLILREDMASSGNDGAVHTWVYDRTERRQVAAAEALAAAGVTEDELRSELSALLLEGDYPRTLELMEIAGFRMLADGGAELYLYAFLPDEVLPDGLGEIDSWRCLYIYSAGGLTRYNAEYISNAPQFFYFLLPPDETVELSPALWCRWGPDGGEPEGGFTQPEPPDWYITSSWGADDFYALLDGALTHYDALSDYTQAMGTANTEGREFISLVEGRYYQSFPKSVTDAPAWAVIDALYKNVEDLLTADNASAAAALAEDYLADPSRAPDALSEDYSGYARYENGRLISLAQSLTLNLGDDYAGTLTAAQTFDRETGAQLTFSDLFSDPDEAARRVADHLSGITGLPAERTAQLLSPYGFFIAPDGRIAVFCSGRELGDDVVLDSTEFLSDSRGGIYSYDTWWDAGQAAPTTAFLEAQISRFQTVGVQLVHYAVPFILPQELLSDLLLYP